MNNSYIKQELVKDTAILDFSHSSIINLIKSRDWLALSPYERIGAVYNFVRNEIKFGYNRSDDIPASQVLADGYGQCNTKGNLLMALLRAVDIPCRIHGFTIHKSLQRGVVPELVYPITPENILHSWIEIYYEDKWINLEGFILDDAYLEVLQEELAGESNSLCAYGAGTDDLIMPAVKWCGKDTYIQRTGINNDLGTFDTPDEFYAIHQQDFPFWKKWLHNYIVRHWMNKRAENIRKRALKPVRFKKEEKFERVLEQYDIAV